MHIVSIATHLLFYTGQVAGLQSK